MDIPRQPPARRAAAKGRLLMMIALLGTATLVCFGRVASFEFLDWDDGLNVAENPFVKPPGWVKVLHFWRQPYAGLYVPLTYTFFSAEAYLDESLPGGAPRTRRASVFHAGNLALHILCVVLVWRVVGRLVRDDVAAMFAALLFALHPLHVESVAWVTETKGLLCAALALTAIWQYLDFREPRPQGSVGERASTSNRRARIHYVAGTSALVLALLAKPAAVSVPLMLIVIEAVWFGRSWRRWMPPIGPWVVIAAVAAWITRAEQAGSSVGGDLSLGSRASVAVDALAFYLTKLFVPLRLGPDYGRTPAVALASEAIYFAWLILGVLLAGIVLWRPRRVGLSAAGLFVAGLVPVLGLVPFSFQSFSTVADRYAYLALLGPSLALAWGIARRPSAGVKLGSAAMLIFLGILSFQQTAYWRDSKTLFTRALEVNEHSWMARVGLGNRLAAEGRFADAEKQYRAALKLRDDIAEIHLSLAIAIEREGRPRPATTELQKALALDPGYAKARLAMGDLLLSSGHARQAAKHYRLATDRPLYDERAHRGLANALVMSGDFAGAAEQYRRVLKINSRDAQAHNNLANVLVELGRLDAAKSHYRAALQLNPRDARAHRNLGLVLVLQSHPAEAIEHLTRAAETLTDDAELHFRLGEALAAEGNLAGAAAHYRRAIQLRADWTAPAEALKKLLASPPGAALKGGLKKAPAVKPGKRGV